MKDTSPSGTLSKTDWKKWREDVLYFSLGLSVIYLTSLATILQTPTHVFGLTDLIPTPFTWGAVVYYILNQVQNLIRKRNNGKEVN